MGLFKEVGLTWKGEEYIVSADQVMGLIEEIEDVITIDELANTSGLRRAKISKAFAVALRYAGCRSVTQQDVYACLFDPETAASISDIVTLLLSMMIPPEHLQEKTSPKPKAPKRKAKAVSAS